MSKKKAGNSIANMPVPAAYHEPKKVTIEKAGNGYVVENYGSNGRKCMIAKNEAEAMKHMRKLMK